jgi:hypothetical protein
MPDVVVVCDPKDEQVAKDDPPPPGRLVRLWRLVYLPLRHLRLLLRRLALVLWRQFFSPEPKP